VRRKTDFVKRWNQPIVILATGPSLSLQQASRVRLARDAGACRVLAVNDAYRLAPFADALYAADPTWWRHHGYVLDFAGEKWTCVKDKRQTRWNDSNWGAGEPEHHGLSTIRLVQEDRFVLDEIAVGAGDHSGFQAINLAAHWGDRVILIGFDMTGSHFFGRHPEPLNNHSLSELMIRRAKLARAAPALAAAGVQMINATPSSALDCFPRASLDEALSCA
jgi:hypothetical protein